MTALTVTTEDTLLIRARARRAMIEDSTCGAGTREVLTPVTSGSCAATPSAASSVYATGGR